MGLVLCGGLSDGFQNAMNHLCLRSAFVLWDIKASVCVYVCVCVCGGGGGGGGGRPSYTQWIQLLMCTSIYTIKCILGIGAVIWIELTNVMVLVADLSGNIGCWIEIEPLQLAIWKRYINDTLIILPFRYPCPSLFLYQEAFFPRVSSLVRQPWYTKTHLTVTSHLLKSTHPAVEILRSSLFKPLGCLLLRCLPRMQTTRSNDEHASYFAEAPCFLALRAPPPHTHTVARYMR